MHNQLTVLPTLPPGLDALWVSHNQLTTLPALPPGLSEFTAAHNPIERVTLPFPQALRQKLMKRLFANTNLYLPNVTLGEYPQALEKWQTVQKGRDVRNARLMADRVSIPTIVNGEHTYTKLPHGPESIVASFLSGLPGNAAQQDDDLKKKAGIAGPAPNRKGYSGGRRRKTRRRRTKRSASKKMDTIL
jgi:hypothetical protein